MATSNKYGVKELFQAVREGRLNQVEGKAETGVDLDSVDDWGRTPLHIAVMNGRTAIVKSLLDQGASSAIADRDGRRPIHFAVEGSQPNNSAITAILCPLGGNKEAKLYGRTPLLIASARGNPETVDVLLKCGADITAKDREGRTALEIVGSEIFAGGNQAARIEQVQTLLAKAAETRGLAEMMVAPRKGPSSIRNWALQAVGLQEKNKPLAKKYGVPPEITGEISKFLGGKRTRRHLRRTRRKQTKTKSKK